jgi:homoserine kinase
MFIFYIEQSALKTFLAMTFLSMLAVTGVERPTGLHPEHDALSAGLGLGSTACWVVDGCVSASLLCIVVV